MKIFIDAGHNPKGEDTGAEGFGLKEQDVAFHIAKRLSELLDGAGADTKLSRSAITDVISYDLNTSLNARGSFILKSDDFVKGTSENRRINNIITW